MSRNNRNKRNRRNNQIKNRSKIIRCRVHNRPVLGHEVCSSFSSKNSKNNGKNCKNCINSF